MSFASIKKKKNVDAFFLVFRRFLGKSFDIAHLPTSENMFDRSHAFLKIWRKDEKKKLWQIQIESRDVEKTVQDDHNQKFIKYEFMLTHRSIGISNEIT